ncbi:MULTISPECIES: mycothiol transferase [unclassified Nonomuraea]|uniref:mycothiol transferase n=1 Tax=unclassified Nonomuraea TaxID=2593643 RepID=UPI0035C07F49
MITEDDYLYYVDRALNGMAGIVAGLGDQLANARPPFPGANSPYALLAHCLGVVSYWAGQLVAGREVTRDRDAEFAGAGPVGPLLDEVATVRGRLADDVRAAVPGARLRDAPPAAFLGPDRELTQGSALLHVYEELAQHHGQMEILRDAILAGRPAGQRP